MTLRPTVALWKPKTPENIGAALRACGCFDADLVIVDPRCKMSKKKTQRRINALATFARHTPYLIMDEASALEWLDSRAEGVVPVEKTEAALNLEIFGHSPAGVYVFGPEEGSVPARLIVEYGPPLRIPTVGCLDLAAAVAIILYDRASKLE